MVNFLFWNFQLFTEILEICCKHKFEAYWLIFFPFAAFTRNIFLVTEPLQNLTSFFGIKTLKLDLFKPFLRHQLELEKHCCINLKCVTDSE